MKQESYQIQTSSMNRGYQNKNSKIKKEIIDIWSIGTELAGVVPDRDWIAVTQTTRQESFWGPNASKNMGNVLLHQC